MLNSVGYVLVLAVWGQVAASTGADLREQRQAILQEETAQLEALAREEERSGQAPEAAAIRARIERASPDSGPSRIVPLPEIVPARASEPGGDQPWKAIQDRAAGRFVDLANQAARSDHYALAGECLRAVIDRQPDHPEARRLLGYVPYREGWATPYAIKLMTYKPPMVLDPTYGWVPEDWVPHLRQGELPGIITTGRPVPWLPAAQADALRGEMLGNPWVISTEHFQIRTNVPLAEAISFGRHLEALHDTFHALLADVIDSRNLPLAQRFRTPGRVAPDLSKQHQVWYFADRDDYIKVLLPREGPDIRESLGIYLPSHDPRRWGVSYFFRDPDGELDMTATLYHEASHQLLFESGSPTGYERNIGNFWVFEGLGTYFETLTPQPDGSILIGGLVGPRIAQARKRIVDQGEAVPIARLVALDKARFNGGDVYLHYAESMALTVFLMQAQGRRYREGFLSYVQDAYKGRLRGRSSRSLEDRLGVPYATLDREFFHYLEADDGSK